MTTATSKKQWHASYWNDAKHGTAWVRAKDALERGWLQTRADLRANGERPQRRRLLTPLKPVADLPNAEFETIEAAISYGVGAHAEYGNQYRTWDETLETKLAWEWDRTQTGMTFDDAMPFIRRGWDHCQ